MHELPDGGFGNFATRTVLDNEGRILVLGGSNATFETIGTCGGRTLLRVVLLYIVGTTDGSRSPLVTGQWRCLDDPTGRREFIGFSELLFDPVRGSLLVSGSSNCSDRFFAGCPAYGGGPWILRIDGFTPLADVLPTAPLPQPLCSNGLDDDGDGAIDAGDAHCKSSADNDESRP